MRNDSRSDTQEFGGVTVDKDGVDLDEAEDEESSEDENMMGSDEE